MASIESSNGELRVVISPGNGQNLKAGRYRVEVYIEGEVVFSKVYRAVAYVGSHFDVMDIANACMKIEQMVGVCFPFTIFCFAPQKVPFRNEIARIVTGPYWCKVELFADSMQSSGRRYVGVSFYPIVGAVRKNGRRVNYIKYGYAMYTTIEATREFGLTLYAECCEIPEMREYVRSGSVLPPPEQTGPE